MRKRNLIMAAGACLAAVTMIAPSALADPTGPAAPPHRPLNGTGSDTTQDVMNSLSNLIRIPQPNGPKQISSWNASGNPNPFKTGDPAACSYTRTEASGSGKGVARLREALTAGDPRNGCLQLARSSSDSLSTVPDAGPQVTLLPFGTDAVSFVIRTDNVVSVTLPPLLAAPACPCR